MEKQEVITMTMNINLTPHLEDIVRKKVASGSYASASEVIREALRLMEAQDSHRSAKLAQLKQDINEGLESGDPIPWSSEQIKQEGRKRRAAQDPVKGL
jgi:antitoxin ParD1/3/4